MPAPKRPALALLALLSCASPLHAGPPFVSDDPEPTAAGHWEIYGFGAGTHVTGETDGAAGLDVNYGGTTAVSCRSFAPP